MFSKILQSNSAWITLLLVALIVNINFGLLASLERGLWYDEVLTTYFISLSWLDLADLMARFEANMGLYYIVLKLFTDGTGLINEVALRALSLAFYYTALFTFYTAIKEYFSLNAARCFSVLFLSSFFLSRYSVEIRGYALATLFSSLLWFSWLKIFISKNTNYWAMYLVAGALGVHSHIFIALLVFLLSIIGLLYINKRKTFYSWLTINSLILLSFLPLLYFSLLKEGGQLAWITKPNHWALIDLYLKFSGASLQSGEIIYRTLLLISIASISAYGVILLIGKIKDQTNGMRAEFQLSLVVLALAVLPALIVFIASQFSPIFSPRYFIPFTPYFILLLSLSLSRIFDCFTIIAATLLLAMYTISSIAYYERPGIGWRDSYMAIIKEFKNTDVFIYPNPRAQAAINFYKQADGNNSPWHTRPYKLSYKNYFHLARDLPNELNSLDKVNRAWILNTHLSGDFGDTYQSYRQQVEEAIGPCNLWSENIDIQIFLCSANEDSQS